MLFTKEEIEKSLTKESVEENMRKYLNEMYTKYKNGKSIKDLYIDDCYVIAENSASYLMEHYDYTSEQLLSIYREEMEKVGIELK